MCQTVDKAQCNRVSHRDKDERYARSSGVDSEGILRRHRYDNLWIKSHEFAYERGNALGSKRDSFRRDAASGVGRGGRCGDGAVLLRGGLAAASARQAGRKASAGLQENTARQPSAAA